MMMTWKAWVLSGKSCGQRREMSIWGGTCINILNEKETLPEQQG